MSDHPNPYAAIEAEARQDALNAAWRTVDACGGAPEPGQDRGWNEGYSAALDEVCKELEKLGARDPDPVLRDLRAENARLKQELAVASDVARDLIGSIRAVAA